MLEVRALTKRYGGHLAVDRVSFSVNRGEVVAISARTDRARARRSTWVVGLLEPKSGAILLLGYVPEEPYLYTHLTAAEYPTLVGRLRRIAPARLDEKVPELLIHDEPFSGLDVNASLLFRALLEMFASEGRMILFSTHRFDMVEKVCSRAVILSAGRLAAEHAVARETAGERDSLEQLLARVTAQDEARVRTKRSGKKEARRRKPSCPPILLLSC